jgi:NAD(P)-dependent dehydrogenase (short-subunit alcohol dehydrogenase family)
MRLEGKVAIVTGAGRGIGAAAAARFGEEGAAVVCADIAEDGARATAAAIEEAGGRALAVRADVTRLEENRRIVAAAVEAFGRLDVLFANAAVQFMGPIDGTPIAEWDSLYRTNLLGVGLGVEAALPALRDAGGGSIVLMASLLGIVGDAGAPAYGAMKGGIRALCRSLAVAHGPEGIRVNTICPGDVQTAMLDEAWDYYPDPEAARARILASYPLGRFATPLDVANVALFLASDDSAFLNGIDIVVDGGRLASIY